MDQFLFGHNKMYSHAHKVIKRGIYSKYVKYFLLLLLERCYFYVEKKNYFDSL